MKSGKTTTASKFPNSLILATEIGYKALPGVFAQDINTWSDFKQALKQLKDDKLKERYHTIIIDTADLLWAACEKFVCSKHGVDAIADVPYGERLCRSKITVKTGKLSRKIC